jgi:hypothetical protein
MRMRLPVPKNESNACFPRTLQPRRPFAVFLLALLVALSQSLAFASDLMAATPPPATGVFESTVRPSADTQIDKLVLGKLKQLNIQPALSSDAVFIRRAYLDVLGTLPTAQEAREFIQDPDLKNKRRRLIDRLLERPEFADYWAMKWGDILRIKAEFPVNLWPAAAQSYHQWIRSSIAENKPYDRFARELLTASGSNFRSGPVNFYRAIQNRTPEGIAEAVALAFMGTRLESFPRKTAVGMAAFFSQVGYKPTREWKEEIVFWNPMNLPAAGTAARASGEPAKAAGQTAAPAAISLSEASFPDGTKPKLSPDKDPREAFADWLISPQNPWFKRAIVNRIWYWLLGRGIIQEPDDIRPANPPSNPALLAYLEGELVAGHYDLKHIYRLILNSQTYQFSSMPRFASPEAEANFASYPLRRLDAEVLIDAINKVTGTTDQYTSPIPEPFTYIPEDMPAVAIGDGSITSPFLTLFGRSSRSTGMADERNNKPMPSQFLHMLNSSHIQRKLIQSQNLKAVMMANIRQPQLLIDELYLTILSRYPTPAEVATIQAYSSPGGGGGGDDRPAVNFLGNQRFAQRPAFNANFKRPRDWLDIAWALVNTTEFLYRH